jgi:hypothetical protein
MTYKEAINYLKQLYPNGGHSWLDEQRIEAIGMAIKALQKESASEEQVKKIIIFKHDDKTCKENGDSLTQPVNEDLEQAIDTYLATYFGGEKEKQDWPFLKKMAIHFAAWQKQQLMAKAIDGVVHHHVNCKVVSVYYNDPDNVPMAYYIPSEGLSAGDKVKIITIKEG